VRGGGGALFGRKGVSAFCLTFATMAGNSIDCDVPEQEIGLKTF